MSNSQKMKVKSNLPQGGKKRTIISTGPVKDAGSTEVAQVARKNEKTPKKTPAKKKAAAKENTFNSLREIEARSETQIDYLETIEDNVVTFALGPAGTGKTYLAVYEALRNLWNKRNTGISRIILTRPVVEAGEKLGFLPGNLDENMDPYMRPLFDSMNDIAGPVAAKEKVAKGSIEIAPVAYMRGRTFHNCFIILDEAQNCTYDQIKMVLTRLGDNTKIVISGDSSQTDINKTSGLEQIVSRLAKTKNVDVIRFGSRDVVRSEIVKDVLVALEKHEAEETNQS